MKYSSLQTPLYENCQVYSIDNNHIFNCSKKKCKWYIKKNLAEIISEEPLVIRLNFKTNGPGCTDDIFFLQYRENKCVCCGTVNDITRHHIFPHSFRKHLPIEIKTHNSYDIVPLCISCHKIYEVEAVKFKKLLKNELGLSDKECIIRIDRKLQVIYKYANEYLNDKYYNEDRKIYLNKTLKEYFGRDFTNTDLKKLIKLSLKNIDITEKLIIVKSKNLNDLIQRWRENFILVMSPKYMPKYWSIKREIR